MAKVSERIAVPSLTNAMYERGHRTAKERPSDVVSARYDSRNDSLTLVLRKGVAVRIPRRQIWEIANASPSEVAKVEVQPGGDGISFRNLDVDIYVPGLLADELGSIFAASLGHKTRGRSTAKKAAASRRNGRKGGRPKKTRITA